MDGLWLFFEICNALFEVLMAKMLAEGFLKKRRALPGYAGVCAFLGAAAVSVLVSVCMNGNVAAVAVKTIALCIFISLVFCQSSLYGYGIAALAFMTVAAGAELIAAYLLSAFRGAPIGKMIEFGIDRYQVAAMANMIFFLLGKLVCRFRKGPVQPMPLKLWGVLCSLPLFSILVIQQMMFSRQHEANPVTVLFVLSVFGLLFINVLIFYIMESVVRQTADRERMAAMETQLALQKEHNRKLAENRAEIQRLSHDFKHHVQALQMLSETGQARELAKRIQELSRQQARIRPMLDTGNPMLDALLTAKRESAEQAGIQWTWEVRIPPELPVPILEVCAILGNALDNAIEACLRAGEPGFIALGIQTIENALLAEVKNTPGPMPFVKDGQVQSRKTGPRVHGIGLKSMEECCKRLQGQISYDFDENAFELRVLIPFRLLVP